MSKTPARLFANIIVLTVVFTTTFLAQAQNNQTPDTAQGLSPYAVYNAGNIDNINPVNGNLFLQIPLLSYPQLGHALKLNFNIYYNDKQWYISGWNQQYSFGQLSFNGVWSWYNYGNETQPNNIGVYVSRDQHLDFGYDESTSVNSGGSGYDAYSVTTDLYGYYVRTPDGSAKHYYSDLQDQSCSQVSTGCPTVYSFYGNVYPATDASGYVPVGTSLIGATQMIGPDGVTYSHTQYGSFLNEADTNGNKISVNANGWTDTIGRSIPGSYTGPGSSDNADPTVYSGTDPIPGVPVSVGASKCPSGTTAARQWAVPSVNGGTEDYYLCYQTYTFQTAFDLNSVFNTTLYSVAEASSSNQSSGPVTMLSAIVLPNTTSYMFSYDQYLSLTQITLPTGGSISYTWQNVPFGGSDATPISRALQTRTLNPGNGEPSETWHYYWNIAMRNQTEAGQNLAVVSYPIWSIVTDPAGNDVEHELGANVPIMPGGESDPSLLLESYTGFYAGCGPHDNSPTKTCSPTTGTLLESKSYSSFVDIGSGGADGGTPSVNPGIYKPTVATTTLTGISTDETVGTYAPSYGTCTVWGGLGGSSDPSQPTKTTVSPCYSTGQLQSMAYYDFGAGSTPGSLLKTVTTNYQWQQSAAYLTANLLDLVNSTTTTNASSAKAAQTTYGYDENNGSPQGTLGNQTSVTEWLNTGGSPETQIIFNSQGMPHKKCDPIDPSCANPTVYSYDSTGEFLNGIQYPMTNTVQHNELYTFDKNTGVITSYTDQNSNKTVYSYTDPSSGVADPLNRLRTITLPSTTDGTTGASGKGLTTYIYDDTVGSLALTKNILMSGTTKEEQITSYDGLGRIFQTELQSDPGGADFVQTTYDPLGRVQSVSNPYRSTTDPTYGITSYLYDALGRKTYECQPDNTTAASTTCVPTNSYQSWSYSGNTVTFTDENKNQWQRTSDALGRLTNVLEPSGTSPSPTLATAYTYDANNNLLTVTQSGASGESPRVRTFTYDSLSRLLCSSNPESSNSAIPQGTCPASATSPLPTGTTQYSYDANGNVFTKTDTRLTTTTYSYDALNRLLSKTYGGSTFASCFQYDGGEANGTGRLVAEWTQPGNSCPSAPASGFFTLRTITGYDAMGRISGEQQCTPGNCTASSGPSLGYTYDLAGNPTVLTNDATPATGGSLALTTGFDSGGHINSVTSNWTAYPTSLYTVPVGGYGPVGPLNWSLGPNLSVTQSYTNRLWVNSISASGQVP